MLSAAGGLGKTTIAYEFATQLLDRPGAGFEKVVWLSGKKITFSPVLGRLVPTTRCDFADIDELMNAFLLQSGTPSSVINETYERDDREDMCIEAFENFSIILIVDDVDSLEVDQQNELFITLTKIISRANVKNDASRILFTSRLELMTGSKEKIEMQGFIGDEYNQYLSMNLEYMIDDESIKERIYKNKNKIFDASGGSPIFITSILRLVMLGHDVHKAIRDWRGKSGEKIRAFAFEREIDQLSETQREILYALQLMARARLSEITELCNLTLIETENEIAGLKNYHLYSVKGDAVRGTVLEVPEPIRLMHDITRGRISPEVAKQLDHACARLRANSPDPNREIALVVSQVVEHWKERNYDVALKYLDDQLSRIGNVGELYCLRARTKLNINGYPAEDIDRDFSLAEKYGSNQFDLLKYWSIQKINEKNWRGIRRLIERIKGSEQYPVFNCCYVYSFIHYGETYASRGEYADANSNFDRAMAEAYKFISNNQCMGYFNQMRTLMDMAAYNKLHNIIKSKNNDRELEAFEHVVDCLKYKYAPSQFLLLGIKHLVNWLKDNLEIISREKSIIDDRLREILKYLDKNGRKRVLIINKIKDIQAELSR